MMRILRDPVAEPVATAQIGHGVVAPASGGAVIPPHGLASIAANALPVEKCEAQFALGVRVTACRGHANPFNLAGSAHDSTLYNAAMRVHLLAGAALVASFVASQEISKQDLRKKLKDDVHASWIYDDLPAALAEGAKTGKPVLAVFRCVP